VPVDHLYAAPVLNEYFLNLGIDPKDLVVVSPDEGSTKRALRYSERLGGGLAIVDKRRSSAEQTRQENIIGASVAGKIAVMFDDMISTAGSICGAAKILHERGARQIYSAATHGVLCGPAIERLKASPIHEVVITDSIPLRPEQMLPKIKVLSVAPLLGEAIKRIHRNESVSRLFD
jgi:ribose-phosphate pyrophosphokinase